MALLLLYVGFALSLSFLCSLLEAALLSARISTLIEQRARGRRGAARLLALKQTRIDDAISAILILNTLANTLGATMAGAQAAHVFGNAWMGVFSGVLTFLILVISEIIPKTLGAVYVRALIGFVGNVLMFLTWLMAPVLVVSRVLTRLLSRGASVGISRGELAATIATASRDGALTRDETKFVSNLLRFNEVQVEDVMTPRTVAFMMRCDATVGDLVAEPRAEAFSRIPLYRSDRDDVVGYVLHREVVRAVARGAPLDRTLESFARDTWYVPDLISVGDALRQFLKRREKMAMVADEHGGVAGIVTLEDLTETILGTEIVDEVDRVIDLRQAAADFRDRRLERLRGELDRDAGPGDSGATGSHPPEPPE